VAVTAEQIKKVVKVASGIIYAQEGNYGSISKNDNKHGMSIGKCQWNAYWGRALPLLQSIVKANDAQAKQILGNSLYNEISGNSATFWNKKERVATEEEAKAISELLSTKEGRKAQDELADADITTYVKNGVKVGLVSLKALAYYADLENQGGSGASKRVAEGAGKTVGTVANVGLEEINAYAMKDSTMGQYTSRRTKVYNALKASELTDVQRKHEDKQRSAVATAQKSLSVIKNGDIVQFIGGGVYTSSTAETADTQKDVVSTCKVTAINEKGTHPYHCISQDGKGVYGWVDKENVK
jgi:hypothetical protein